MPSDPLPEWVRTRRREIGDHVRAARTAAKLSQEQLAERVDLDRKTVNRIEQGTYGICRDCGEPIAEARLNAIPWTRVCITCKAKQNS